MSLTADELRDLDAAVEHALTTGDESGLRVLGYGEISTVLALDTPRGRFAAKRMPPFPDQDAVDAYRRLLSDYARALGLAGVRVVPTEVVSFQRASGGLGVYVVQPALDPESLLPRRMARADGAPRELLARVVERVAQAITPRLGLDAQLSNWAETDGDLAYLDVSTPLMRDAVGRERLDTELFLCSLPWALRPLVRRFALRSILDKYYLVRGALLDIAGNLQKEGLERQLGAFLELANRRVEPAITEPEVRAYYTGDARMWSALQRLRRADRAWQKLRGRTYPFLLPGAIVRRT